MGRRALRKPSTTVDLARYLRTLGELPAPLDPAGCFGRVAPLEVEVGSGKGLFLSRAAAERPAHDFIGIEIAGKYATAAAMRLARADLHNAFVIAGDALRFFREWATDASLTAVHVYFPDPWWKKRHKKRRVLNLGFLRQVERTLKPGGKLHFWTDVEEYYLSTLEIIREVPSLVGPSVPDELPAEHDLDYRTHFERRTRLEGQPVYRSFFVRA